MSSLKRVCLSFFAVMAFASGCTKQEGAIQDEESVVATKTFVEVPASRIVVDPSVELALVLAVLSPLDENQVNRSGEYYTELLEYFGEYQNHPAINALGSDFNLPRLVGNSADFKITADGSVIELRNEGSLWKDAEGDLFRRYRSEIEDFAKQSNFISFYEDHQPFYDDLITRTRPYFDLTDMVTWISENFDEQPQPVEIYVSPLMAGFHWTTIFQSTLRIWVNVPFNSNTDDLTPVLKMRHARAVFTELDHSSVNPITSTMLPAVEAAYADLSFWGNENAVTEYGTEELMFNEYMTWAVFLLYAQDRLSDDEFAELKQPVVRMMEERRGFIRFGLFADHLIALQAASPEKRAQELFAPVITWSAEQS